jgi:hypothetical protein
MRAACGGWGWVCGHDTMLQQGPFTWKSGGWMVMYRCFRFVSYLLLSQAADIGAFCWQFLPTGTTRLCLWLLAKGVAIAAAMLDKSWRLPCCGSPPFSHNRHALFFPLRATHSASCPPPHLHARLSPLLLILQVS